ncbi:SDR family oxidoreductase [Polymorphobacter sp.]|uniref:SDR family oxidoreductase n=1 Tax=Polymorphobacter sp. TaxID=1909290 RepID=UPI003F722A0B
MVKTAVITGASQGLGLGIARALAARGVQVMLAAPNADALADAAATVAGAAHHPTDVRDPAQTEALAAAALGHFGRIDLWLNNAGQALTGTDLLTIPPETFATMVDINLKGALHGSQAAARAMADTGGTIWNTLGAGADGNTVPQMNGYATSKAALTFLTKALAAEAPPHLAFAAISPGLVLTEGFFRENARITPAERTARNATVNILADTVETVSDWAADLMLAPATNGAVHDWLTPEKIAARRAQMPPRDILATLASPLAMPLANA